MESQQKTLDNVIKNRKRSINEHGLCNKELENNIGINKLSRQLSFDSTILQSIKKQKVENGTKHKATVNISNAVMPVTTNNILGEKEKIDDVNSDRAITPEQSPSTKAQLRQILDLGEFHKIDCPKQNIKELQEKLNLVEQYQNDLNSLEYKVEAIKYHCLPLLESDDLKIDTSPIKYFHLKPTSLFPSPRRVMMDIQPKLTKVFPNDIEYVMTISPIKQYSALADSKALPLPLKYRILNELFKVMETVLSMKFLRKEKITFYNLKQNIQQITRK